MIPRNCPDHGAVFRKARTFQNGIEQFTSKKIGTVHGIFTLGPARDLVDQAADAAKVGSIPDATAAFRVTYFSGLAPQTDDHLEILGERWRVVATRGPKLVLLR